MSRAELADNLLAFNSNYFKNDIFLGMSSVDYHCKKNKESTNNTKNEAQGINVTLPKSDISNYVRDIALLKHCGIKNFRFALSWSLIIPDGTGECDQDAIAFYNEVLDLCIENNIVAFVSIFDSILPPLLEKKGGVV
jgi:beta-glucosidase/6-phospho-beta-glucosidase/beta-galactosidase